MLCLKCVISRVGGGLNEKRGVKTLQKVWYHIWTAPYKEEVVDIFIWLTLRVSNTGCFNTSLPPLFLQPYCVMVHLKSIYFQNPISIPDYHARFHKSRGNSVLDVVFPTRCPKWIFIFLIVLVEKRHQTIRNPVCVTLLYLSHIKQGNYT